MKISQNNIDYLTLCAKVIQLNVLYHSYSSQSTNQCNKAHIPPKY